MLSGEEKPASAFKSTHARYRRRPDAPERVDDLDEMVDFHRASQDTRVIFIEVPSACEYQGSLYGLKAYPGFLFAPSALAGDLQKALALSAVTSYCEAPHTTNIDGVPPKSSETVNGCSMWDLWKSEHIEGRAQQKQKYYRSFSKVTWATLGYHYDWTSRAYHEGAKSPMPDALSRLGSIFAMTALRVIGACSTEPASADDVSYEATACIVNYYNSKSVMGGHRDDLEEAISKPIVSVSLGRPAVFLLGGRTVDCELVFPVIVRPGDVVIMGGDCRLNYHAMSRLLPAELPTTASVEATNQHQLKLDDVFHGDASTACRVLLQDCREQEALADFLGYHRININLRQVYNN